MGKQVVEFVGVKSGDHECPCWDVDADTFERLTGDRPSEMDKSCFNEGLFRYYPHAGVRGSFRVRIELEGLP